MTVLLIKQILRNLSGYPEQREVEDRQSIPGMSR